MNHRVGKVDESGYGGRITGSEEWRRERGEMGSEKKEDILLFTPSTITVDNVQVCFRCGL